MYGILDDLAKTVMNPTNCRSSTLSLPAKDNSGCTTQEPVYVYTDVFKPNLIGDSYVRLLTYLNFLSKTEYHRFDYPFGPVDKSFRVSHSSRYKDWRGCSVEHY